MTSTATATTSTTSSVWSSSASAPIKKPTLLLVDDDRAMRMVLHEALAQQGYEVKEAASGEEALEILEKHPAAIDAVVLDREMPGMKGLDVVARMKESSLFSCVPVIMVTGTGEQEKIQEGIDAGVYYYLVKPVENSLLKSVIGSALRERMQKTALLSELHRHSAALKAMHACQLAVRTITEAEDTACLLASCFPHPEQVVTGLMELLVNAVEHGNLGIDYEEKQELLQTHRWREELDRRAYLIENADRVVTVNYQRKDGNCLVQITDAGKGFDWKRYWHINPARATSSHGRGIARARLTAFDRMAYNDAGNSVTVMVSLAPGKKKDYAW